MAFSSHHLDFQVEQEFPEVSGTNYLCQDESRESIRDEQGIRADPFEVGIAQCIGEQSQLFPFLGDMDQSFKNIGFFLALCGTYPEDGGKPLIFNTDVVPWEKTVNLPHHLGRKKVHGDGHFFLFVVIGDNTVIALCFAPEVNFEIIGLFFQFTAFAAFHSLGQQFKICQINVGSG